MSSFWIFLIYEEFLVIISTGSYLGPSQQYCSEDLPPVMGCGLDALLWPQAAGSYFLLKNICCHFLTIVPFSSSMCTRIKIKFYPQASVCRWKCCCCCCQYCIFNISPSKESSPLPPNLPSSLSKPLGGLRAKVIDPWRLLVPLQFFVQQVEIPLEDGEKIALLFKPLCRILFCQSYVCMTRKKNFFKKKRRLHSRCLYTEDDLAVFWLLFLMSASFICKDIPCKCTVKIAKSNKDLKINCDLS